MFERFSELDFDLSYHWMMKNLRSLNTEDKISDFNWLCNCLDYLKKWKMVSQLESDRYERSIIKVMKNVVGEQDLTCQYCDNCMYKQLCSAYELDVEEEIDYCDRMGIKKVTGDIVLYSDLAFNKFADYWYSKNDKPCKKNNIMLSNVIESDSYVNPNCVGDINMREVVDYYLDLRNEVMDSIIDKRSIIDYNVFVEYEYRLLKDDVFAWWHVYDKKHISRSILFLRELKIDMSHNELNTLIRRYNTYLPDVYRLGYVYGVDMLYERR